MHVILTSLVLIHLTTNVMRMGECLEYVIYELCWSQTTSKVKAVGNGINYIALAHIKYCNVHYTCQ